jgi:hypothetical protein
LSYLELPLRLLTRVGDLTGAGAQEAAPWRRGKGRLRERFQISLVRSPHPPARRPGL